MDARFIAELDRTDIVGEFPCLYVYGTGGRSDGFDYAAGLMIPGKPADGSYALFKRADDAILYAAAWWDRHASDGARVSLLSDLDVRARELAVLKAGAGESTDHLCDDECGDDSHPRDGRTVRV